MDARAQRLCLRATHPVSIHPIKKWELKVTPEVGVEREPNSGLQSQKAFCGLWASAVALEQGDRSVALTLPDPTIKMPP